MNVCVVYIEMYKYLITLTEAMDGEDFLRQTFHYNLPSTAKVNVSFSIIVNASKKRIKSLMTFRFDIKDGKLTSKSVMCLIYQFISQDQGSG